MDAKQALAKTRALLGGKAVVEDGRVESSPQIRLQGGLDRDRLNTLLVEKRKAKVMESELKALVTEKNKAASAARSYRYRLGTVDVMAGLGMFFVTGQGDSWDEALLDAETFQNKYSKGKK